MAYIEESKINEIRNSVNIVDIIKEYVPLTSKGKNFFGVCPFHEDHAPSMSVSTFFRASTAAMLAWGMVEMLSLTKVTPPKVPTGSKRCSKGLKV